MTALLDMGFSSISLFTLGAKINFQRLYALANDGKDEFQIELKQLLPTASELQMTNTFNFLVGLKN